MEETLYTVEEFCTTGWESVEKHLSKAQASKLLESMMNNGVNPNRLRVTRED
jgi:hypothetical protein